MLILVFLFFPPAQEIKRILFLLYSENNSWLHRKFSIVTFECHLSIISTLFLQKAGFRWQSWLSIYSYLSLECTTHKQYPYIGLTWFQISSTCAIPLFITSSSSSSFAPVWKWADNCSRVSSQKGTGHCPYHQIFFTLREEKQKAQTLALEEYCWTVVIMFTSHFFAKCIILLHIFRLKY